MSFISYPPVVLAFLLAVTLHNFPEGLAVGVGFGTARRRQERDAAAAAAATATTAEATSSGGGGSGDEGNYFNGARSLAFGIALQNFPGARLSYASSAPLLLCSSFTSLCDSTFAYYARIPLSTCTFRCTGVVGRGSCGVHAAAARGHARGASLPAGAGLGPRRAYRGAARRLRRRTHGVSTWRPVGEEGWWWRRSG